MTALPPSIPADHSIIGTCSICGGVVLVPTIWWGTIPPVARCHQCGAVASPPTLPVIPMNPVNLPSGPILPGNASAEMKRAVLENHFREAAVPDLCERCDRCNTSCLLDPIGPVAECVEFKERPTPDVLDDGFGNQWSPICPMCGQKTMEVVRPGKVQCVECG